MRKNSVPENEAVAFELGDAVGIGGGAGMVVSKDARDFLPAGQLVKSGEHRDGERLAGEVIL